MKVGPNVQLPKNWSTILHHPFNKIELLQYLSDATVSNFLTPNCDLNITSREIVSHVGPDREMQERIDHEDADTKIVVHLLHAMSEGAASVLVKTVDSHVLTSLIYHYSHFISICESASIIVNFGIGKHARQIDIGN